MQYQTTAQLRSTFATVTDDLFHVNYPDGSRLEYLIRKGSKKPAFSALAIVRYITSPRLPNIRSDKRIVRLPNIHPTNVTPELWDKMSERDTPKGYSRKTRKPKLHARPVPELY